SRFQAHEFQNMIFYSYPQGTPKKNLDKPIMRPSRRNKLGTKPGQKYPQKRFSRAAQKFPPCENGRGLVGPFRSRVDRNQSLSVRDIPNRLDPFNNEPVNALRVGLEKLSRNLHDRHDIVSAGNDMNLFDLGKFEQRVSNLRLLAQDRGHVDEGTNMPLHLPVRMVVSSDQILDVSETD